MQKFIILQWYSMNPGWGDSDFFDKHADVLNHPVLSMGSPQEAIDREAITTSFKKHLVELGLLCPKFKITSKGELPEFDWMTGMMKEYGYDITSLGKLILRYLM